MRGCHFLCPSYHSQRKMGLHYLSSPFPHPLCVCLFFFSFLVLPVYCYQPISLYPRACVLNHVTPWTTACQAPLSVDFSRQECWGGLLFPSPLRKSFPLRPFPFGCQLLTDFIIIIYHLTHLIIIYRLSPFITVIYCCLSQRIMALGSPSSHCPAVSCHCPG